MIPTHTRGTETLVLAACLLACGAGEPSPTRPTPAQIADAAPVSAPVDAALAPTATLAVDELAWDAQPILAIPVDVAPAQAESELRAVYFRLIAASSRIGLELAGPPMAQILERGARIRLLAAVPVRGTLVPSRVPAGVSVLMLPSGPAVRTRHRGRHDQLPAVHQALRAWMQANQHTPRGEPWERYLTNLILEPDPAKQETEAV